MEYRTEIAIPARVDIGEAYRWRCQHSMARANRWLQGLYRAIDSLQTNPKRFGLAPESEAFGPEIRQLLYGKRRNVYRVLYTVEEDTVTILYVRHASRPFIEPEDSGT